MKGKILFLAPMNPMGIGGGSFATHAYLRAFSSIANGNIDVIIADSWKESWDTKVVVDEKVIAYPMTVTQYMLSLFTNEIQRYSRVAESIISKAPEKYSYIVSNGSSISGKLYKKAHQLGIKLITIHHNCEPEYFVANSKGLHRLLYLPIVKKLEKRAYINSDYNLFLTEQDELEFNKRYGSCKGVNGVLGVFEFSDYVDSTLNYQKKDKLSFVITGSLCTMQGIDGIKYFFSELYHHLPNDCEVVIAGRNPSLEIQDLCARHSNVRLIPNPKNMHDVISSCDIYICPTRVGGGLKLRVMDGLKLGLPVVTHKCSARGYDAFFKTPFLKSFTNGIEFKQALQDVLDNYNSVDRKDLTRLYESLFSYDAGIERIKSIIPEF